MLDWKADVGGTSPAVANGLVFVATDGAIRALDAPHWLLSLGPHDRTTPLGKPDRRRRASLRLGRIRHADGIRFVDRLLT
ncbi:MAG: PQQ-binding-like beta-propeller repeat protein [Candidatus Eremiobacteraeota bacterium]|nr:PQQ-binding-like beta-propeller repeat protein [Candidatus Eremiobacteraeota bacterium]